MSPDSSSVDWDRLAPAYGRQVWLERSSLGSLLGLLDPKPDDRLLDIGTGTAELLRALARRPDRPTEAIGVDQCQAMLDRAGGLPDRWGLRKASGEALPFEDQSFDIVTASYLLHVLDPESRAEVISEARRVLKPGGRLASITIAPPVSVPVRFLTAPIRWAARQYPSIFIGLSPLDPAEDLRRAGLNEIVRGRDFRGYPALCLVTARPAEAEGFNLVRPPVGLDHDAGKGDPDQAP